MFCRFNKLVFPNINVFMLVTVDNLLSLIDISGILT